MSESQLINIKDTTDPHYRYKMPKLTAKIEGNGNGIKTVLTNISVVAKSLRRPASYPTKYFGCELGAQVYMQDDLYIVNGAHDADKLLNYLYGFIKRFVLCPKCSNPETDLSVCANGIIRQKCIACGHMHIIDKQAHRLTTFIINHPPSTNESGMNAAGRSDKNSKTGKDGKKSATKKHAKTNGNGTATTNGSREEKKHSKKKSEEKREVENDCDDEADFDDEELSEQAYLDRLHDGLANGMFVYDAKKSADVFYKLVKAKKEANLLLDTNVQKELFKEATVLGIRDKATLILGELLFTDNIFDEIVTYRMLLLRFCSENPKAQKYLLGAYEKLVGDLHKDVLFPNATKILKQLYDRDIVEEETILEWATKESKKYVSKEMSKKIRERVAPFVKWLKEAEQDDDDDDENENKKSSPTTNINCRQKQNGSNSGESSPADEEESPQEDEDDLDLEFSHRVSGIQISKVEPTVVKTNENCNVNGGDKQDEDEINIDDI